MITRSNIVKLVLYSMLPFCFIDVINGYFSYHGYGVPLSQLYKTYLIILLLVLVNVSSYLYVLASFLCLSFFYQSLNYTLLVSEDVSVVLRTLIFVIIYFAFHQSRYILTSEHLSIIKKIFILNWCVICVSVFSGVFGYGLSTYGNHPSSEYSGIGFKGYFYAGNELGALLICMFPIVVTIIKSTFLRFSVIIIFLFISFLIGTKTAFISMIILCFYSLFILFEIKAFYKVLIFLCSLMISIAIYSFFYNQIGYKQEAFQLILEDKGAIYLILSGRDELLLDALRFVSNTFTVPDYFLGVGSSFAASKFKSVEMDFADLFIWNGIIWVVYVYSFYFYFSKKVTSLLGRNQKKVFSCMFMLLGIASIFAGHILTSAMLLPLLGLFYPYAFINNQLKEK